MKLIEVFMRRITCSPGARFSKDPKLFGRISGDIILLVSLKRRRLEARNFAVFLDVIPFTTYEQTSFTEYAGRSFTNGFLGPKSFREFRETASWSSSFIITVQYWTIIELLLLSNSTYNNNSSSSSYFFQQSMDKGLP